MRKVAGTLLCTSQDASRKSVRFNCSDKGRIVTCQREASVRNVEQWLCVEVLCFASKFLRIFAKHGSLDNSDVAEWVGEYHTQYHV